MVAVADPVFVNVIIGLFLMLPVVVILFITYPVLFQPNASPVTFSLTRASRANSELFTLKFKLVAASYVLVASCAATTKFVLGPTYS